MDTNLVNALVQALSNQPKPESGNNSLLIATMIIAALGPIIAAVVSFIQSRANYEARKLASETAAVVEKVHVAVNSGQTAMIAKFDAKQTEFDRKTDEFMVEIKRLTSELATAAEKQRGSEVAIAKALTETQNTKAPAQPLTAILSGPIPMPVEVVNKK